MAFALSVFLAQVDGLLASEGASLVDVAQLVRYRQIKQAVERYSTDRPDEYTEDLTGDGGKYYPITSLTKFTDFFSRVTEIEYPAYAVTADHQPHYLDDEDWWDDYRTNANTRYLFFPNHTPAATETARVKYTLPYLWVASSVTIAIAQVAHGFIVGDYVYRQNRDSLWVETPDQRIATHIITVQATADTATAALLQTTIPVNDFFALCNLAAGYCCQAISDKYSRTADSSINADSVGQHTTRAGEFSRRAKELIGLYEKHLGLGEEEGRFNPAGEFTSLDVTPGWPGNRKYLFHGGG